MYRSEDNIVALATAVGFSAINIVRCSGPDVLNIVEQIIPKNKKLLPNTSTLVSLRDPKNNEIIDRCLVTVFIKPKSYTGQNVVEISAHGGQWTYERIIDLLISGGCRIAERGEFTYRAFINGKMDLIQAEAVSEIINNGSGLNAAFALDNLQGALSQKLEGCFIKLQELVSYMEHELDFNENEIEHKAIEEYLSALGKIINEITDVYAGSFLSSSKKPDFSLAIVGKPNAGKSSLFNCIVGYDRSIVTNISGTTRDTVDVALKISGLSVSIVDTAGLRKTKNMIEKKGIERTIKSIRESDCIIVVDEENPGKQVQAFNLPVKGKDVVLIKNKVDIFPLSSSKKTINVSCLKKTGIKKVLTHLSTLISDHRRTFLKENSYLVSKRLHSLVGESIEELRASHSLLKDGAELSVVASRLHGALDLFRSFSASFDKNDIINNIFKGFCVGK